MIKLLEMEAGVLSFEFEEEDIDAVKAAILELFEDASSEPHILYSEIQFGGEAFTFYNEWGPCLIASTQAGGNILRALHDRLKMEQAQS